MQEKKTLIPVYYNIQMHNNHKNEEHVIKNVIYSDTKFFATQWKIKYYLLL